MNQSDNKLAFPAILCLILYMFTGSSRNNNEADHNALLEIRHQYMLNESLDTEQELWHYRNLKRLKQKKWTMQTTHSSDWVSAGLWPKY